MTHRQARRKLGSRSNRRRSTNGKVILGGATGGNRRSPMYTNPRKTSRRVAVAVARLATGGEL